MNGLTFAQLREANMARCEASFHPIGAWSVEDWGCALLGEIGETANLIKKRRRGDHVELRAVADELADAVIYLDLLAAVLGVVICDGEDQFEDDGVTEVSWLGCRTFERIREIVLCDAPYFGLTGNEPPALCNAVGMRYGVLMTVIGFRDTYRKRAVADVLIAIDQLACAMGIDLEKSIIRKFNEVSDRVGSEIRLGGTA